MILLIDIGGTNIKYGIMDSKTEKYQSLGELPTKTEVPEFRMEDRLKIIIDSIKESHCLTGIAISSAGIIDPLKGKIIYANKNIPNYKGTNLKRILEEKYKLPVTVENDVNSALLGELNYGDYQNVHSALMITIGT
ncbi:MAG: ROK family protein, partial [Atopostipes sp.]|nr:ROK family protein [Atopostipes sp.]